MPKISALPIMPSSGSPPVQDKVVDGDTLPIVTTRDEAGVPTKRTRQVTRLLFLDNPHFNSGLAAYGQHPIEYYYWNNAYPVGNTYITMNKNNVGNDASHVYCQGGMPMWEVGATTEVDGHPNDFHFKVVKNTVTPYSGANDQFIDVLMIDYATGGTWIPSPFKLGIGGIANDRLHLVSLGPAANASRVTATFENANGGTGSQSAGLLFKGIDIARSWMQGSDYGMNGNSNWFVAHGSGSLALLVTQTTFEVSSPIMMGISHGVYSAGTITSGAGSSTITDERFVGSDVLGDCPSINHFRTRNTIYSPSATTDLDGIGKWQGFGYYGGTYFSAAGITLTHLGTNSGGIQFATNNAGSYDFRWRMGGAGNFLPYADNAYTVGTSTNRVKEFFGVAGAINTSDAREKTAVRAFTDAELAAAKEMAGEIGTFQWKASIKAKGKDKARRHVGMTVQRAVAIMESHGLDPFAYGFICHDTWDAEEGIPTRRNKKTGEITPGRKARKAGDRYGFRMDQLLAFIARGQEQRLADIEARLARLDD